MQPDTVNDVAFHPFAGLVALGTGQRHFPLPHVDDDDEDDEEEQDKEERQKLEGGNRVSLYKVARRGVEENATATAMEEEAS